MLPQIVGDNWDPATLASFCRLAGDAETPAHAIPAGSESALWPDVDTSLEQQRLRSTDKNRKYAHAAFLPSFTVCCLNSGQGAHSMPCDSRHFVSWMLLASFLTPFPVTPSIFQSGQKKKSHGSPHFPSLLTLRVWSSALPKHPPSLVCLRGCPRTWKDVVWGSFLQSTA